MTTKAHYRRWLFRMLTLLAIVCWSRGAWPVCADDKPADSVPLSTVVLFNSGVGYFEHVGEVEGNATVDLKFNVEDVNDLLKSMVLQDLGGGTISTVTYGSRDPITKTLKTFSIDLTKNPSLADLLGQIRGERVEVEAPNKIEGTIVGVETRKQRLKDETIDVDVLNLLTNEGLRGVSLMNVSRIQLLNPRLDSELRQALDILAAGHATDKKTVSLKFLGEGRRKVRVGYVQETPVWKTSYRLVLKENGAPFLQGWSIVENTTEMDWRDVSLSLVSGRPISFQMDLYQPLYVRRPTVVPELYASLSPRKYEQDLAGEEARMGELARKRVIKLKDGSTAAPMMAGAGVASLGRRGFVTERMETAEKALDIASSVPSAATAADVGELFQYKIDTPVTLSRRQSAMLPIVNSEVQGEKVSIYNEGVHAKYPLNGLKLRNSTPLHLMQGPVTVFDGGTYAGDAQLPDLAPGAERLISYAMDLDTEVAPASRTSPEQLVSVKIQKGVMTSLRKYRRTKTYTAKNSGDAAKTLLIEHPIDRDWKLVAPEKPSEETRSEYRFRVVAAPGKPEKLDVAEEYTESQSISLTNVDDNSIRIYLSSDVVSEKVKSALQSVVRQKQALSELAARIGRLEQRRNGIAAEQDRIRQNMQAVDRSTDLYNRYVKKFTEQEDEIDKIRKEMEQLQTERANKQRSLDEYLLGLDVS